MAKDRSILIKEYLTKVKGANKELIRICNQTINIQVLSIIPLVGRFI